MKVPPGVLQAGRAMMRKYEADEYELKMAEIIRDRQKKELPSVDDILAAEAKQEQRRKPATAGKVRQSKSLERPVEDNPWHRAAGIESAMVIAPEQELLFNCGVSAQNPGTKQSPAPVTTAAEPPTVPATAYPEQLPEQDQRPFGDTPPRDVPRPALVAFAVDIILREGPQSTNALLDRAFPDISSDDRAALRQRLPKWLMAEYREADPPLTGRRYRAKEGNEKREKLFGFWPEPHQGKSRQAVDMAEVLTTIAELRTELVELTGALSDELVILQRELVTLRQVQSELLQRQNLLKEGLAAMLEKLTWNGEF